MSYHSYYRPGLNIGSMRTQCAHNISLFNCCSYLQALISCVKVIGFGKRVQLGSFYSFSPNGECLSASNLEVILIQIQSSSVPAPSRA